jgi:hypothetical protein
VSGFRRLRCRREVRRGVMPRAATALIIALVATTGVRAERRPIDVSLSRLTVHGFKSGLFSAFADNHVVRAPIARGILSDDAVEIGIRVPELTVLDPDQSARRSIRSNPISRSSACRRACGYQSLGARSV